MSFLPRQLAIKVGHAGFCKACGLADRHAYNGRSSSLSLAEGNAPFGYGLWMPEHIKKQLLAEIELMEHELAHELPAEIKKAASLGDLSENAEYHMAKQRQVFVNARLGQLKKRMAELSLVNLSNIPRDKAGFGSTVVVFDSTKDEEIVYRLVTSEESDVTKGLISTTSPIGRGLVGRRVGDVATIVTPNGKRELEVLKLTTIHDEAEANAAQAAEAEKK
jgi:transcription elongation factor GreA